MRYKITFSYDGSKFNGYQKQKGIDNTIQGIMENALKHINDNKDTRIYSSGRTDKGVSAYKQVAHFDIDVNITPYKLKSALNTLTPDTIYVIDAEKVDNDFHARYMAKEKTYIYKINTGIYNPIEKDYVCQLNKELDIDLLKKEIKDFIGTYDYSAFISNEDKKETNVRTIKWASVTKNGDIVTFSFTGNGFLKYMVRIMSGYLISVSLGKEEKGKIKYHLSHPEKKVTTKTAGPAGLYLKEVKY